MFQEYWPTRSHTWYLLTGRGQNKTMYKPCPQDFLIVDLASIDCDWVERTCAVSYATTVSRSPIFILMNCTQYRVHHPRSVKTAILSCHRALSASSVSTFPRELFCFLLALAVSFAFIAFRASCLQESHFGSCSSDLGCSQPDFCILSISEYPRRATTWCQVQYTSATTAIYQRLPRGIAWMIVCCSKHSPCL